ncbi:hypothetical protein DTO166G4_6196 [Paecilomyces variotii]|nr:hypothetical protein DTO166G4_6196 [Paecilomyces variotii]KAJ9229482.1 hypothetical protein DTO166G5_7835 [Paecilomyces variotii]
MQEQLPSSFREDLALLSSVPAYQSVTGTPIFVLHHVTVSPENLLFLSPLISLVVLGILWKLSPGRLRGSHPSGRANTRGISGLAPSDEENAAYVLVSAKGDLCQGFGSAVTFQSRGDTARSRSKYAVWVAATMFLTTMLFSHASLLALAGYLPGVLSLGNLENVRRQSSSASAAGPLDVFQVYQPVTFDPASNNACNQEILLMEHQFAASYGHPFVGNYEPPQCDFDTTRINLTVTSKGRQFDRLALMFLGDVEVFRTSTAEPTTNGIVWTYIKEMSQYNTLWKQPQKLIFDLGNLIDNTYTGPFNVTLTASFTHQNNVKTADVILPISSRKSSSNSSSAFTVPSDNTTVAYSIPGNVSRAIVSISACGQSTEEFWWSNVFSSDTADFTQTAGELNGYSPFREVQLLIDGILAGVVWPFPVIFTGGVAPGFWRPIVGINAFDLREPEIDVTPFIPLLTDGKSHTFEIKVLGLDTSANGTAALSNTVGSYWVVTGKVFLYFGDTVIHGKGRPQISAPEPQFFITRNLVQNAQSGANESLSYSVRAERNLTVRSSSFLWSQTLSYSNFGLLTQQGISQRNNQSTVGTVSATSIGSGRGSIDSYTTFSYPLDCNSTYGITDETTSIDATISRGLDIDSNGGPGISTYTLTSGPSTLHTKQYGEAHYFSTSGGSSSSGETTDIFNGDDGYQRYVKAVNGTVVSDTAVGQESSARLLKSPGSGQFCLGRNSVRSILGRGPSTPFV